MAKAGSDYFWKLIVVLEIGAQKPSISPLCIDSIWKTLPDKIV
ncbi:MAG: hypothetical protein ANABAC_0494 [Anaerolineae bacterium]|nr:MAG: hypothetical protein ANABAC_0494 [Anaerolineae bacterium]